MRNSRSASGFAAFSQPHSKAVQVAVPPLLTVHNWLISAITATVMKLCELCISKILNEFM